MTNLELLKNDLEQNAMEDYENNQDNYIEGGDLTEEDKEKLQEMEASVSSEIVVKETAKDGTETIQPIRDFAKGLDEKIAVLGNGVKDNVYIKALNSGDIKAPVEQLKAEAKESALKAYHAMSLKSATLSDDEFLKLNDIAIGALKAYFMTDRLEADKILNKLKRMPLKQIISILPADYVKIYVDNKEIIANNIKAKERLLTVLGYLMVTGPEMDYLNDYIETESKLATVSQRLLQAQMDFAEMLKDETKVSEMVARTVELAPIDMDSFWTKYIRMPNRIHNEFAQRCVIQEEYLKAYNKIMEEYTGPDAEYDDEFKQRAAEIIQAEIDEATQKIEVYRSVTNLDLMRELYQILEERYTTHKKLNAKFLIQEGTSSVDRARRSKLNVPFPGFKGTITKPEVLFYHYITAYSEMIANYNATIADVTEKAALNQEKIDIPIDPIHLDGYDDTTTAKVFSLVLLILMGRIMKKLSNHDCTKYDAIQLDSYYRLFCQLGTDIYTMSDVWNICKPLTEFIVSHETMKNVKW